MATQASQQMQIDLSGSKGLAPHFSGDQSYSVSSPNLRYLASDGQMVEGVYNPFKKNGYMSPANFSTKDVTITSNGMFRSNTVSQYDPINQQIFFSGIIQLGYGTNGATSLTATSGTLLNNNNGYQDLEIYTINDVPYLFALYKDGSGLQNIAGMNLTGHSWDSANVIGASGTASGNVALSKSATKMLVSQNGFMYILDKNNLYAFLGTSLGGSAGTLTNVITWPSYFSTSDAIDFGGNLYIGLHKFPHDFYGESVATTNFSGDCGIYIWDKKTIVTAYTGTQSYIPIPQARFIRKVYVGLTGAVRCIVTLIDGKTGILEFNGYAFKTIVTLGQNAFPPYIDSVQVTDTGIWWQSADGNLYFHGSPSFEMPEGLYCLGKTSTDTLSGQAMLFGSNATDYSSTPSGYDFTPEAFYRAYEDVTTSTFVLKKWYLNADSDSTHLIAITGQAGNVYTSVKYLPKLSTIQNIKIYCIPNGASGDSTTVATLSFYANQSITPFKTVTVTRSDIAKGYLHYELNKPYCNAFQMKISWDTTQGTGTNDFAPSIALLEYLPNDGTPR